MNKYYQALIPFLFCLIAYSSTAQQLTYSKVINGCEAKAVVSIENGVMLVGQTDYQGLIAKLDLEGNIIWAKKYSGAYLFTEIIMTSDSAFIIGGRNDANAICLKVTSNGDVVWFKELYNGTTSSIVELDNGELLLLGTKNNSNQPYSSIALSKLLSNGNLIWTQYYKNGNYYHYARTLHLGSKGEYIISGTMASYPPYNPAGFIFKTDTSGNILWSQKFQTADSTFFSIEDFIEIPDGLICYAILEGEVGILQLDTSGNLNWCKKYQDLGEPEFNINMRSGKLHSTADSNYVLVNGSCWISAIAKFDPSGNLFFSNIVILAPIDVLETADNGYLIVGDGPMCAVKTEEDNGTQIGIIKTDSLGNSLECTEPLNYIVPIDQNILALDVDFIVDSDDISNDSSSNILNVELSISVGCVDQPSFVNETQLTPSIKIFPNPASSQITIEINNSANTSYKIQLIDLLGKK